MASPSSTKRTKIRFWKKLKKKKAFHQVNLIVSILGSPTPEEILNIPRRKVFFNFIFLFSITICAKNKSVRTMKKNSFRQSCKYLYMAIENYTSFDKLYILALE